MGIGDTTPDAKLDVEGNARFDYPGGYTTINDFSGVQVFNSEGTTGQVRLGAAWGNPGVYSSGDLHLLPGGGSGIYIKNDGKVGIGMTATGAKLEVLNGNGVAIQSYGDIGVRGHGTGIAGVGVSGYGTNTGVYASVTGGGITTITYGVQVFGGYYGVYSNGGTYSFYATGAGIPYGSSSSIRWKKNIQPIDNALEKILSLRGVYFNWDEEHGDRHDVGMISEEVGKVMPEIVSYEEDGVYATGMDYSRLTPLLVEAIKELKAEKDQEIEKLKARIEALEGK